MTILLWAVVLISAPMPARSRTQQEDKLGIAAAIQEFHGVAGRSFARRGSVRVMQLSDIPQMKAPSGTAQTATLAATSATTNGQSLVLQTFPGPVQDNPPDPAMAVGPNHIVATVNAVVTIYDKKGTVLFNTPLAVFMSVPGAAVWDAHVLYDANSGHFFIVCVTGDQRTTGAALLAVSATPDARGTWFMYTLNEAKNAWLDFPSPAVTSNALVLSFMDIAAQGSTQQSICATEVIGLPELVSGNQSLKITRFDSVFGRPGQCNYAYPAINYDPGNIAYLLTENSPNGGGNSLALARIDTSGTPTLDVSTVNVPQYSFPNAAAQKGSATGIIPGGPSISGAAFRNGSLWCAHTNAATDGKAVVRWYEIDPGSKTVKQVGDVAGVGNAWMGAIAVLPDNEVDLVYTTSSSTEFASAGYAHRTASDPPNTMPISGVFQAGSGTYTGVRWGDFFEAWADPDGQSAWGIAELMGTSTYATAIVQLAHDASVKPQIALTVSPTSAIVNAGDTAQFTIAVAAQNAGAISLACSGLPGGATCTFSPSSLNGPGTVALTISTTRSNVALLPTGTFAVALCVAVGIILIPGIQSRARHLGLLLVIGALTAIVACGGTPSSTRQQPTPPATTPTPPTSTPTPPLPPAPTSPTPPVAPPPAPQSFAVTITATGAGAQASATVKLTVQ